VIDQNFEYRAGQRIRGLYAIERVLAGGMGIVFITRNIASGEMSAAKTFPNRAFGRNSPVAARFVSEALIWMRLGVHPNIVTAERVEAIDGRPFIFLEYVNGGDLSELIRTGKLAGSLPWTLQLAINFCDGMEYAIQRGLKAHRDIKPQNCLLDDAGVLKVTDFGLAKALENEDHTNSEVFSEAEHRGGHQALGVTQTGHGAGTPAYMSPEQFQDIKRVDVRADVYSFGIMLFQMFTGTLPFRATSWDEFARLHARGQPPQIAGLPKALQDLITSCLEKDPSKRIGTFTEIRRVLDAALRSRQIASVAAPAPTDLKPALTEARWASSLSALGRNSDAVVAADRAVQLDPESAFSWGIRGEVLIGADRPSEAAQSLRTATHLESSNYRWWFGRAVAARNVGDRNLSHQYLEKALAADGKDGTLWGSWAELLVDQGHHDDALKAFHRALELDPYSAETYVKRGDALRRMGRHDEAHVSFLRASEVNPRSATSWERRAHSALEIGQPMEALESFAMITELIGPKPLNALGVGQAYEALGDIENAIASYELAIRGDPNLARAWLKLGVVYLQLGRLNEATDCLDQSRERDPESAEVWLATGHVNLEKGQLPDALVAYTKAVSLGAEDGQAWLSITFCRLGQYNPAHEWATIAIKKRDSGVAHYAMGLTLEAIGRQAMAISSFQRAFELGFEPAELALARCQAKLRFS